MSILSLMILILIYQSLTPLPLLSLRPDMILSCIMWVFFCTGSVRLIWDIVRLGLLWRIHQISTHTPSIQREMRVSVIIPAYNESNVILRTIESILLSHYSSYEIIVIDDGSTDLTYDICQAHYANMADISIHTQPNHGKGSAINHGISLSDGEIIIIVDADTLFDRETISALMRRFTDESIGAVSGVVHVGNRINLITRIQEIEYQSILNTERLLLDHLNSITIVPGAIGAWRKSILIAHGGFCGSTLAEDHDMTLAILEDGYRIVYAHDAHAYTEAPETWTSFYRQRFRWVYGSMQVAWKHRSLYSNTHTSRWLRYYFMPLRVISYTISSIMNPLIDILLITCLSWILIDGSLSGVDISGIALSIGGVWMIDTGIIMITQHLYDDHHGTNAWYYYPLQLLIYRGYLHVVRIHCIISAIRGIPVGWNKLPRTNNVSI